MSVAKTTWCTRAIIELRPHLPYTSLYLVCRIFLKKLPFCKKKYIIQKKRLSSPAQASGLSPQFCNSPAKLDSSSKDPMIQHIKKVDLISDNVIDSGEEEIIVNLAATTDNSELGQFIKIATEYRKRKTKT